MGPGGTMPPHDPNWRSHSAEPEAADGFSGALKPPSRRRSRTALQVMLSLPPAALAFSPVGATAPQPCRGRQVRTADLLIPHP